MRTDAAYDEEQQVIGDLEHLDDPSTTATIGSGGGASRARHAGPDQGRGPRRAALVGRDRDRGLRRRVTVHFEPAAPPALRRAGGVDVACVLYPDEGSEPSGI